MNIIYIIEGLVTSFTSYEEAEKFRKWYNKEYGFAYYIEPEDIKKRYCFNSAEEAMKWTHREREW